MNKFLNEQSPFLLDLLVTDDYDYDFSNVLRNYEGDFRNYLKWETYPNIVNEDDYHHYVQEWFNETGFSIVDIEVSSTGKFAEVEHVTYTFKYYDAYYQVVVAEYKSEDPEFISDPVEVVPYQTTITKYKRGITELDTIEPDTTKPSKYSSTLELKGEEFELIFKSNQINKMNKITQILDIFKND
jgi:hypothetical protein